MCKDKAHEIWKELGENERQKSATTIAVIECTDGKFYCMSNDVDQISDAAIQKAKELGISPIGEDYISQAGAGFHAEMWAVLLAMEQDKTVSNVIKKIGASRACCKYCSGILKTLNVTVEEASDDVYKSWYNPLTIDQYCKPRENFQENQLRDIPDFRNHSADNWFTSRTPEKYQKVPPANAK